MTEPGDDAATAASRQEEAARRRRLAEVFGDVLPDSAADEPKAEDRGDRWYEENRPPHHGG